jgi:hypothetical protein
LQLTKAVRSAQQASVAEKEAIAAFLADPDCKLLAGGAGSGFSSSSASSAGASATGDSKTAFAAGEGKSAAGGDKKAAAAASEVTPEAVHK